MTKNTRILLDIECYPNYFEVGIKDYDTKTVTTFEVDDQHDERKELFQFLTEFKGYLITFNGVHYDNVVLAYFVKEYKNLSRLSAKELCTALKSFSNLVIDDDFEKIKWYKWFKHGWTNIDLYLYWAKSLRISKKISLKSLGIQLNHEHVQELPYPHNSNLTVEQREDVRYYNTSNDLGILEKLCTRMTEDIKLRAYVTSEYGIPCWSMDAPKITSEYLLQSFCKKTWDQKTPFNDYVREIRQKRYTLGNWKIGDYLPPITFKTKFFQDLLEQIKESDHTFSKIFHFKAGDTSVIVSMGIGGIHILNENEIYKSDEVMLIVDQDVTSLYPTLLALYKLIREELTIVLDDYLQIKADRVQAKREGNKNKDTFMKLMLNGFTGLVDSDVMWLYSPEQMITLRVYGQLIQLRVLEEMTLNNIRVISNNTDGTTVIVPKNKLDLYHQLNIDIAKEFQIDWEYSVIDKIVYSNVNNYIGFISKEYMVDDELKEINVKEKPKVKKKGLYKYGNEIPLGDSVNEQVVARALELFWSKNVPIEESIKNPDKYGFHIYDYCRSNKIDKSYEVIYDGKVVQNLNRYYFQRNAPLLFKRRKGETRLQNINVGEGVCLFNVYEEKSFEEYNIDYKHYVRKAQELIDSILIQQLSLF